MSYTTQSKVEQHLGITFSGGGVSAIADIILAVKAYIDKYCQKTFEAASETRTYDGNGQRSIVIDSFVGTPVVKVLTVSGSVERTLTMSQSGDFIVSPYNSTEKFELILTGLGSYSCWPAGVSRLQVIATFGYSTTVPADVQFAATKLAGQLYNTVREGIRTSIRLGDYQATYATIDEQAQVMGITNVLDQYRDIDV